MSLIPKQPDWRCGTALPLALSACLAAGNAMALEIPSPTSAAEVTAPSSQVLMHPE